MCPQSFVPDEVSKGGSPLTGRGADLWQVTEHLERPAKKIPVIYDVDVAVAGGGIAGIIAALAAAGQGVKTLIIEPFGTLGGNMGPGLFAGGTLCLSLHNPESFKNGLGGIPQEFNEQVVQSEDRFVGRDYFRDSHSVSYVATKMLQDAGVEILLSTLVTDVIKSDNKVGGLFVDNKSGTAAIKSQVVIDCTGTADIADRAGAPVLELEKNPSMGIFFSIAGFDWNQYEQALENHRPLSDDDLRWMARRGIGSNLFMPWSRQAWEAGEFKIIERVDDFATLEVSISPPDTTTRPLGEAGRTIDLKGKPSLIRARTRVNGNFHPGDGLVLSRIQQEMDIYLYEYVAFLRKRVPGFEHAYLFCTSPYFHARGGKSIDSVYMVTPEDVERGARFDDLIYTWYDDKIHVPGGCDIPYRMLLPKKIDGLLAAGRSAIRRGPQIRQRYSVQLMGQAAGVAAAQAVKAGVAPRDIDVKQFQKALYALGSEIAPDRRLKELEIA